MPPYRNLGEPGDGYVGSFAIQGGGWRTSWERGLSKAGIGASAKEDLRKPGAWKLLLTACGEIQPRWDNRITLHPTKTDPWGMPLIHIEFEYSENDKRMGRQAKQDIHRMLSASGCVEIEDLDQETPGGALSDMGTVVMGRDPAKSVLNSWNQIHEVPNVFVTDGSCVASSGDPGSPSLTLMALTARAANHAAELIGDGKM